MNTKKYACLHPPLGKGDAGGFLQSEKSPQPPLLKGEYYLAPVFLRKSKMSKASCCTHLIVQH